MSIFASGNHLIWIRPSFQDNVAHDYNAWHWDPKTKKKLGGLKWGDENNPPEPTTWFSIAVDRGQSFWIVRHNPVASRRFMQAITGTARQSGSDLHIFGTKGSDPFLVMLDYQYPTEGAARLGGSAVHLPIWDNEASFGNTTLKIKGYRQRTRYVRQLDSSMMTPDERLCEMTQCAIDDPDFSKRMKAQFGMLGDPVVLFQLAMILGVFVGIGAGAEFLGGAAFAAALMRLLGIAMVTHQLGGYVSLIFTLHNCCFSDKQSDFVKGVQTIQQLLLTIVSDIAMFVTMEGAMMVGSKAIGVLKRLITEFAPEAWVKAAKEFESRARHKVSTARARMYGYASENLLKRVPDISKLFRKAEIDYFMKRSAKYKEMIVIRGPSLERMEWLTKLRGWLDGKSEWIKAKSWMGWTVGGKATGLVGVPKHELNEALAHAGIKLAPTSPYPMGNLRGVFKEIDAYIDGLGGAKTSRGQPYGATRPAYEIPVGVEVKVNVPGKGEMKIFDWEAARHKGMDARGYKLVDVGDRYLIVDSLGRPICQDLDIGAAQKIGTPSNEVSGSHVPAGRVNPEDNYMIQEMANWKMARDSGHMYSPYKHSAAGSGRHIAETNLKNAALEAAGRGSEVHLPWRPRLKDGSYDPEHLYVVLPLDSGGAEVFFVQGWAELEQFWKANQSLFGSKWEY